MIVIRSDPVHICGLILLFLLCIFCVEYAMLSDRFNVLWIWLKINATMYVVIHLYILYKGGEEQVSWQASLLPLAPPACFPQSCICCDKRSTNKTAPHCPLMYFQQLKCFSFASCISEMSRCMSEKHAQAKRQPPPWIIKAEMTYTVPKEWPAQKLTNTIRYFPN